MLIVQLLVFSFLWAVEPTHNHSLIERQPWLTPNSPSSQWAGVYVNGDATPLLPLIQSAEKTIDIEIYEMNDPEVNAALMEASQKRKVRIRIVKDDTPVEQSCRYFKNRTKNKECSPMFALFDRLNKTRGSKVVPFNKDVLCGKTPGDYRCFQHGKMMIVDNQMVLISTGNFNNTSLCSVARRTKLSTCNRDYTVVTRDADIVSALRTIFDNDLNARRTDIPALLRDRKVENKITISPFSYEPIKNFILTANNSIQFQNQYIYADSNLVEVLGTKAKEGVNVQVQVSDVCYFDEIKSDSKAYELDQIFRFFESASVKLRMFTEKQHVERKRGYLHAKAIVVDGAKAWIGSVNGSGTSLNINREFGIFVDDPAYAQALSRKMEEDMEDDKAQTWRDSMKCRALSWKDPQAFVDDNSGYAAPSAPPPKEPRKRRTRRDPDSTKSKHHSHK